MKRTTKYVAFDVHQATTEGRPAETTTGPANGSATVPQRNAMRDDAHCCTSKLILSGAPRLGMLRLRVDTRSIEEKRDDFLIRSCTRVHAAMNTPAALLGGGALGEPPLDRVGQGSLQPDVVSHLLEPAVAIRIH